MDKSILMFIFLLMISIHAKDIHENTNSSENSQPKASENVAKSVEPRRVVPRKSAPSVNATNLSTNNTNNNSFMNANKTEIKSPPEIKLEQNKNNKTLSETASKISDNNKDHNITNTTVKPFSRPNGREGVLNSNSSKEAGAIVKTDNTNSKLTNNESHPLKSVTNEDKNISKTAASSASNKQDIVSKSNNNSSAPTKITLPVNVTAVSPKLTKSNNTVSITTTTTTTTTTVPTITKTSTTTTTTTTTTTPPPKKPKITYSVEDMPSILDVIPDKIPKKSTGNLNVEEPEQPIVQPSKELNVSLLNNGRHKDYIIPLVALIFSVPVVMGAFIISYRKIKDYWSTRHYRRMDFLVDGMYND